MKLAVFRKHVDDWKYHDSDLTIKKPYWLQPIRQLKKSLQEKHITFEIKKQRKPRVSWHAVGKGIKRYTSMKI